MTSDTKTKNSEIGLYREIIDLALANELENIDKSQLRPTVDALDAAELPNRVGEVIAKWVTTALMDIPDTSRAEVAHVLAARIHGTINEVIEDSPLQVHESLDEPLRELAAIEGYDPAGKVVSIQRPLTPIGDTVLFTNARGEPSLISEIAAEIDSADRIDLVLAFIRWTGIRDLIKPLTEHISQGKKVRVLTTIYTGSTEARALDSLAAIGVDVKVSYDAKSTRLHAKAWQFFRKMGLSTVYIGSSNLTYSAVVTGMEWNVRASEALNPDVVRSFESTFESYWQDSSFETYDRDRFETATLNERKDRDTTDITPFDITPYPFQRALLEQLQVERSLGRPHSLLVAATGTGKTVMAALDYKHLRTQLSSAKLLFIAHRKEILRQSMMTFRHVLKDGTFGDMWVDGQTPTQWNTVFASVQTLAANGLEKIEPDSFDVVIVDEFHHAAATTYTAILNKLEPKHLIGLTATPERTDGLDIKQWFGGRFAVELRLWDALEEQLLAPFHYFGIADGTDLTRLKWRAGQYSSTELTDLYTANDIWLSKVVSALRDVVSEPESMRALGFCVSIEHAKFMARKFQSAGFNAQAVTSQTSRQDRAAYLHDLRDGKLQILFTVDLFNEGVDVPAVDTILMLRPTESATIFLQQLGRGLRKHDGKSVLTVLDFVGQQRQEFRFDQRFSKWLGRSRREIEKDIEKGFPFLPAGCQINLDPVAREIILNNVKKAIPGTFNKRVAELKAMGDISLSEFLYDANLNITDIYTAKHYWTSTRRAANLVADAAPEMEAVYGRGIGRMLHIDDAERIEFYKSVLSSGDQIDLRGMSTPKRIQLAMLLMTLLNPKKNQFKDVDDALSAFYDCGNLREEVLQLLECLLPQITHMCKPSGLSNDIPLLTHATYSRDEVLAAFGASTISAPVRPQGGVYWHKPSQTDLLFVTLDKSSKSFSPTTRYHDYAISDTLFHWESQSTTSLNSSTGQRYINQVPGGTNVALFIRRANVTGDGRTGAYFFAGLADYAGHKGERPIAITWKLRHALPGDVFGDFRAAVA